MRVNLGGDPGRDDYGLPPVDIDIPDDARELDRDVQAYHRELRAQRWRRRTRRLAGPLTRDGMVLPLLAGCLALTLLAGTLLTVFSGARLTSRSLARPSRLPDTQVLVDGNPSTSSRLHGSVLALVPSRCKCGHLAKLAREAASATVEIYVVGASGVQLRALIKRTGVPTAHAVEDKDNALARAFEHPGTLTAVLVNDDGSIAKVVPDPARGFQLASAMRSLRPHPGGTGTATVAAGPAGG
jgi:hypothetical protein